ncbi:MAG TPA: muramoyltetrapeptide carboxypeptidase [Oxalicibacterium sp.]|jgi:muramoyltetrapeptide carboxypeptidase|nr:muramoyltetrapeptide carboxypeptidase [Oxalicibacterium sp.]
MTNAELNADIRTMIAHNGKTPVVAIIALSGYALNDEAAQRGIVNLCEQGCHVRNYYESDRKFQRFAATDEGRLAQIHAAARDPEVDIVLALRGGYGLTRLLPQIDFPMLAASGKFFIGHSDFTALQMGLLAHGASSFAGPMLCDDFLREELSAFTLQDFWQCVSQEEHVVHAHTDDNPVVDVEGMLWGGNLAMLTHLVGSSYLPTVEGGILFVEDVNEHPYRVERMLLQLAHAGILGRQKALLLGDFSAYKLSDYDNGYDYAQMVAWLRAYLPIPVLTGLPFGHGRDKVTLVNGARAQLHSRQNAFELVMRGYPGLSRRG